MRVLVSGGAQGHQLVDNGALGGPVGPTWEVGETDWWHAFEMNLRGTAFAANAAIRTMSRGRDQADRDMESEDPHQHRVSKWARSQRAAGRFTPVEQSADLLARIVSGEFDHLSGGLITPASG